MFRKENRGGHAHGRTFETRSYFDAFSLTTPIKNCKGGSPSARGVIRTISFWEGQSQNYTSVRGSLIKVFPTFYPICSHMVSDFYEMRGNNKDDYKNSASLPCRNCSHAHASLIQRTFFSDGCFCVSFSKTTLCAHQAVGEEVIPYFGVTFRLLTPAVLRVLHADWRLNARDRLFLGRLQAQWPECSFHCLLVGISLECVHHH